MQIVIGASGWQHDQWQGQFYPDDIPLEWRFSYYANEFDTLLLPFKMWSTCKFEEIESWLVDVPKDFDLFLEVGENPNSDIVKKLLSHELFAHHQVKFTSKLTMPVSVNCEMQQGIIIDHKFSGEEVVVLRCFSEDVIKLDEIRQIIEKAHDDYSKCDRLYLFFDQALLDIGVLNNAKIIVDLLIAVE